MNIVSFAFAITGGFLWTFGLVGKRYGTQGAPLDKKSPWSAGCALLYCIGNLIAQLLLMLKDVQSCIAVVEDPEWKGRFFALIGCGICTGCGMALSFHTLSIAQEIGSSAIAALVMNGIYTAANPIVLSSVFGEGMVPMQWIGAGAVCLGVMLLEPGIRDICDLVKPAKQTFRPRSTWNLRPGIQENLLQQQLEQLEKGPSGPSRLVVLGCAVVTGLLWLSYTFGLAYGTPKVAPGLSFSESTMTLLAINIGLSVPAACWLSSEDAVLRSAVLQDALWQKRAPGVLLSGMLNSLGGTVGALALAMAEGGSNAITTTIENGSYVLGGSFLIAIIYQESLTPGQLCGCALVALGVLLLGL